MSYIDPSIKNKFEELSIDLKNVILTRGVHILSIYDLMRVLEEIISEG